MKVGDTGVVSVDGRYVMAEIMEVTKDGYEVALDPQCYNCNIFKNHNYTNRYGKNNRHKINKNSIYDVKAGNLFKTLLRLKQGRNGGL